MIEIDKNKNLDWEIVGRKIRNSNHFPHGTNVNFVKKINHNTLQIITYEKGVEKIMESCGSGSVAAAYHMYKKHNLTCELNIQVTGGHLFISNSPDWKTVWLRGPVKLLFNSTIDTESI